jgi:uncharacterized protein YndB with AHSA1/START domain
VLLPVRRDLPVPAERAWDVLTDLDAWPRWGPSVAGATLDGGGRRLTAGASGRVRTSLGVELPFTVTAFEPGRRWAWRVMGVPATGHRVEPLGDDRCRVVMEVPVWAAPYGAVCWWAIGAIGRSAS